MALDKISVSPSDYVVLDVETNGLRSKDHDLLSLSIYKPDDGKEFERFFPLDLNDGIPKEITRINGITIEDLKGKEHLTQEDFDFLIDDFELETRTILHYGAIDMRFVRDYLKRQHIEGFEKLNFFNFKKRICSSRYSSGNLTKDNLCEMFEIEGVKKVHSGLSDCKLEWELFKKIDGDYLLVSGGLFRDKVFRLNEDYIVPVSYLGTYPNLSKAFERPYIVQESEVVFRHTIKGNEELERFDTNISGVTIEHLLNTLLDVEKIDSKEFLLKNKSKLQLLGYVSNYFENVPMKLNNDGTVTAIQEKDRELEQRINRANKFLKPRLNPIVDYIKNEIFKGKSIRSQELRVDNDMGILALCDLSTDETILEIKTGRAEPELYAEQLFYEANGRDAYLLCFVWDIGIISDSMRYADEAVELIIYKVDTFPGRKPNKKRDNTIAKLNAQLASIKAVVEEFENTSQPILLKCQICNQTWQEKYYRIGRGSAVCPTCHPESLIKKEAKKKKPRISPEERNRLRIEKYAQKVKERSDGKLVIDETSYTGSKEKVRVACELCGYSWELRADHLLARCFCPKCSYKV